MRGVLAVLALAACGPREAKAPAPIAGSDVTRTPADATTPDANQEAVLAAIQKAMNELDEAVQVCWAVAATERFDVEGEVELMIDIGATGVGAAKVVRDTTRNVDLQACVTRVLARYPWAPPLHGQAIRLPFEFRAPEGQNTIDRGLVTWRGQGQTSVAVLIDENNTGNAAASILEVALQRGGSTGLRRTERDELWLFLGAATVQAGSQRTAVVAGDMMFVPAQGARDVQATAGDVHAVVVMTPGGREGSARAGALPTREVGPIKSAVAAPVFLPAAKAKVYPLPHGRVRIYAEPATIHDPSLAASVLELPAGATVPEHAHARETELLYMLAGSGTLTVAGQPLAVTPTMVIQLPPNTKHAFTASAELRALQIYTPAGPERRFKAKP